MKTDAVEALSRICPVSWRDAVNWHDTHGEPMRGWRRATKVEAIRIKTALIGTPYDPDSEPDWYVNKHGHIWIRVLTPQL